MTQSVSMTSLHVYFYLHQLPFSLLKGIYHPREYSTLVLIIIGKLWESNWILTL